MTVSADATRAFEGVVPESSGGSHDALDAMNTGHAVRVWFESAAGHPAHVIARNRPPQPSSRQTEFTLRHNDG